MRKRFITVFLTAVVIFAGCGSSGKDVSYNTDSNVSSEENIKNSDDADSLDSNELGEESEQSNSAPEEDEAEISLSNSSLKETQNDISIKDFDLDVSDHIEYGDKTKGFTYKNNTDKTIEYFQLELRYKDDMTENEKATIINEIDSWMKTYEALASDEISESDKYYLDLWENSKDELFDMYIENNSVKFTIYDTVEPGEISPTKGLYNYEQFESTWELLVPYMAEIKYDVDGTDGETKTYTYVFDSKTEYTK